MQPPTSWANCKPSVPDISIPEAQWEEMRHRQTLLDWARANGAETGATHIALIDADEILTGNLLGSIREHVARLNAGQMLNLPLYNLRGGLTRYHLNGIWGQRTVQVAFKDVNTAAWKGDKFHSRAPHGVEWRNINVVNQGDGGVLHLWGVSERRLRAKSALYKITERLRWPDKPVAEIERMYSWAIKGEPGHRSYGTPETWTYGEALDAWWEPYRCYAEHCNINAEPWQEAEIRYLIAEHGAERFQELDLFGVV